MIYMGTYLIYLGLVLFSFVLEKHQKQIFSKVLSIYIKLGLSFLGTIVLVGALIVLIKVLGLSLGLSYFFGLLLPLIVFIALVFTYIPKMLIILTVLLALVSLFF